MRFRVLGAVDVGEESERVSVGPLRQRAVLAALVVDSGRLVPVDVLVDRVWGGYAPDRALRTLHTYISRLRRVVERAGARVVRCPGGYLLEVDPDQVDLHRFHWLVQRARDRSLDERRRLELLRDALSLWRGEPLAGIPGEWAERTRGSWQQQYVDAAVAWAAAELRAGDPAAVCGPLRDLVQAHPLVEPLVAALLRALHASGRTAEALECFAAFRLRLAEELGTDPGPEVQAVHQMLLHGTAPAEPVAGARWGRSAQVLILSVLVGVLAVLLVAVVPPLAQSHRRATAKPGPGTSTAMPARTKARAPLFDRANHVIRVLPANSAVVVICRYGGDPPPPWRSDGYEYHILAPNAGHIPGPYLTLRRERDLRACN
jgi:DNA-binding SARP family transcriptional activator